MTSNQPGTIAHAHRILEAARQWHPIKLPMFTLAVCLFAAVAPGLRANPITWAIQMQPVFSLGGTVSGSFTFDATTDTYSNILLTTSIDGPVPACTETVFVAGDANNLGAGETLPGCPG